MKRREFLKFAAAGAGSLVGTALRCGVTLGDIVPDVVRIDSSDVMHSVPAHRGVMWMFREAGAEAERGFDGRASRTAERKVPDGEGGSYGSLVDMQKEHVALAAKIGVNTFRCGINHSFLEERNTPGRYNEKAFTLIERLLDWCGEYGIKCVFDLHGAIGRDYGGDPRLWQRKDLQDRFCAVWRKIAQRFRGHPQILAFEPLNEPEPRHVESFTERYKLWNDLSKRVTDTIRAIDVKTPIIINSVEYAHPSAFAGLEPLGDTNMWYSFHWYDPRSFHMQKRPWIKDKNTYHYPGIFDGKYWNRETMRRVWRQPVEFAAGHKSPLFVGEFGCVSNCPEMEDMIWLLDVISLMDECNISWTYYHYMALAHEAYWRKYFDCGMFTYDVPNKKLYAFGRKVSLLSDLMKLRGKIIRHPQPIDDGILVYSVLEPRGGLRVYVSNKSRRQRKSIRLYLAGGHWDSKAQTRRMARGTDGFVDASPTEIQQGRIKLELKPLSILRLNVEPVA